jgi:hypothetical protein
MIDSFSILAKPLSILMSSLAPNSVGSFALPLMIGLMYGWLMLTILPDTT